jgi:hypothetical protein
MANPRMRENGFGHLPQPGRITRDEDGGISESTLAKIQSQLELITQTLNGGLRLKSGGTLGRAGNFKAQMIEVITPGSANTEFTVPHSLNAIPEGYFIVLQDKAGSLYTSNFGGWDRDTVYFKSDVTSMLVNVILYA